MAEPADGKYVYAVYREGSRVGTHTVEFAHMGDQLTVKTDIDIAFGYLLLFEFSYTHQAVEVWSGGQLKEFTSFTDDDGDRREVHAWREGDRLLVNTGGSSRTKDMPGSLIPGSLWHPSTVERTEILDPIKGRLRRIGVVDKGRELIDLPRGVIEAHRFSMSGGLEREIWYDSTWMVVKVAFKGDDGSQIALVLQ